MIRIAICDDETTLVNEIYKIVLYEISKFTTEVEIKCFTNGNNLLEQHQENPFEIVFLDIDMPKISGFDIAKKLRENFSKAHIIFITSHEELVYESMDFQPFHFLRKHCNTPLEESMSSVIKKLMNLLKQNHTVSLQDEEVGNVAVMLRDVIMLASNGHYVDFYINGREKPIKNRITLKECEKLYGEYDFVKVHRSYLVNLKYLSKIDNSRDEIYIGAINKKIVMSKNYKKDVGLRYTLYLRAIL